MTNIEAINIIFENGDNIIIKSEELKDFLISNLDQNGNEIPYETTIIPNKLYANFLLLKLNKSISNTKITRLKNKYDIIEIGIIFKNNTYINFDIASDANPFTNNYHNSYEYIYENENDLGLLLSKYNIKYKDNLFI